MKALRYTSLLALPIVILGMILIVTGCGGGGGGGGSVMNGGLSMLGVNGNLSMHFTVSKDNVNRRFAISANAVTVNVQLLNQNTQVIASQAVPIAQIADGVSFNNLALGQIDVLVNSVDGKGNILQAGSASVNINPGQNQVTVTLTNAFGNFDLTGTFKFVQFDSDNSATPNFENADGTVTFDGNGTVTNVTVTSENGSGQVSTAQFVSGAYQVNAAGVFTAQLTFQQGGGGTGTTTTLTFVGGVNSSLDTITCGAQIIDQTSTRQGLAILGSAVPGGVPANVTVTGFSNANVATNLTGGMIGEDQGQGVLLDRATPDIPNDGNGDFNGNSSFVFNEGTNGNVATDLLTVQESPAPSYAVASDGSFSSNYVLEPQNNQGQSLGLDDTTNVNAGTVVSSLDFMFGEMTRQGGFAANGLGLGAYVNPAANATNANLNGIYNIQFLSLQNSIGDTTVGNIVFDGQGNIVGGQVLVSNEQTGGAGGTNTQTIPDTPGGYTVHADGSFTATFVPSGQGASGTVSLTGFIDTNGDIAVSTFTNNVVETDHPVRNTPRRAAAAIGTVVQNFGMVLMTK